MEAVGDLVDLGLEEEDLLEVLFELTCPFEVALERLGRSAVGADVLARDAVRDLFTERERDRRLERGDDRAKLFPPLGRRFFHQRLERALDPGEHLEQADAGVFVDKRTLARDLSGLGGFDGDELGSCLTHDP